MRVVMVTTWNTACGIATYSSNLIKQLRAKGLGVEVFSATENYAELAKFAKLVDCDVVHIQHEFGIMPETSAFMSIIAKLKSRGIKVVLTTHTEDDPFNIMIDGCVDAIVLHNDIRDLSSKQTFSRFVRIPHGIPEISFTETKDFYRKKYGIPENAFVIGTCGFLVKRSIPEMVNALTKFIETHEDVYLNLVTSAHIKDINQGLAKATKDAIMTVARQNNFDKRIMVGIDFTPTEEFRERIKTLDLGFAYANQSAKSNSGAAADIVSCGVPVIANDAPHFSHLKDFIVTTKDQTPEGVAKLLEEMYDKVVSPNIGSLVMQAMSAKALNAQINIGYSQIAKRHIDLYKSVLTPTAVVKVKHQLPVLDKTKPIVLSIPNDIWQVLAIWPKLYNHISSGFKINIAVQHDGLTDMSILQFVLAGIDKIYFDDVHMVKDPYLFRMVSKNVSQKISVDLDYWLRSGHTYEDLFPDSGTYLQYPRYLGDFAEKQARKLMSGIYCIISLTPSLLPNLRRVLSDIPFGKSVIIMASPINAHILESVKDVCKEFSIMAKFAVEDTRTRWAMCKGFAKIYTAFDDIAIISALDGYDSSHNAMYLVDALWQAELLKSFKVSGNAINLTPTREGAHA